METIWRAATCVAAPLGPVRSLLILAGLVLATSLAVAESRAQPAKYPDKPIKMLVGFSAGGGTDVIARILAQKMTDGLGQSVLVENRPGASGLIAADAIAKSPADGYTLMMGSQTTFAVAPQLYRKFSIDPPRDFAGVALAGVSPLVLVVHPSVPVQSVKDVIGMAKANPGTINFGSGGLGTTPHMAGELFALTAGIKMQHVAYRGEAPAINDLLGGQLHLIFANLSAVIGNVRAGSLRAIAVTSAQRSAASPEIPTAAETGLPGFEAATWFAVVAPAATPRDVVMRLNGEIQRALVHPDVRQRFADLGMTSEGSTPDSMDALIKSEIIKWAKVIRDADIKAPD
jgi:tripartite-type tricarboxylate transporter receptor subunit TctC